MSRVRCDILYLQEYSVYRRNAMEDRYPEALGLTTTALLGRREHDLSTS